MVAFSKKPDRGRWLDLCRVRFAEMLPQIRQEASAALRDVPPDRRATLVEEVIERLTSQLGCEVEITLEISARRPEGFDESTVRTISENSRTLKFEGYGFEEG